MSFLGNLLGLGGAGDSLSQSMGLGGTQNNTSGIFGLGNATEGGGGLLGLNLFGLDNSMRLPVALSMMGGGSNSEAFKNAATLMGTMGPKIEEKRLAADQKNKTLTWMKENRPDLAAMVEAGMPIPEAWAQVLNPKKNERKTVQDAYGRQRYVDTGEYVFQDESQLGQPGKPFIDPKKGYENEQGIRKEYDSQDNVKNYTKVRDSYEKIRTAAATDSGPGDLALIFNYMKMLDPGSVVREGEFATAQNSGGVSETVRNYYNAVISGERLSPELRAQFVKSAEQIYGETAANLSDTNTRFGGIATQWGVDPSRVTVTPEKYEPIDMSDPLGLRGGR